MGYRFLFGAVLCSSALGACGGSSSETPPPLQPDPAGFRYATVAQQDADESDAGNAPRSQPPKPGAAPVELEANPKPRTPARSTWGTGH